jgi:hypothetical protein
VDLRAGGLVSPAEAGQAAFLAGGTVEYADGGVAHERLRDLVRRRVPATRVRGAEGARWSVAVDAALNDAAAWTTRRGDLFVNAWGLPGETAPTTVRASP